MNGLILAAVISITCFGGHPGDCHASPPKVTTREKCLAGGYGWGGTWRDGHCEILIAGGMTVDPMPPCEVTFVNDGSKRIQNCDLGDPKDLSFLHAHAQK